MLKDDLAGLASIECTVANLLSLSRIPLATAVWMARKRPVVLAALMGGAGITDILDGWFARKDLPLAQRLGVVRSTAAPTAGAWLDPLCDKIFVASLVGALFAERRLSAGELTLVSLRDLLFVPLFATYRLMPGLHERMGVDLRASRLGKLTTCAQFLTLGAALFQPRLTRPLAAISAAVGLCAVLGYAGRAAARWRETSGHGAA